MGDGRLSLWLQRAGFLGLALLVIFFHLLPMDLNPAQWAAPDIMLAMAIAWAGRRPELVPVWLVALTFLLMDAMLQRPPGLWSALAVLGVEWSKSSDRRPTDLGFTLEWASCAGVVVTMTLVYRGVLSVAAVPPGPLHLATTQAALTVAVYPLVVLVTHFIFGIRRAAPNDLDTTG